MSEFVDEPKNLCYFLVVHFFVLVWHNFHSFGCFLWQPSGKCCMHLCAANWLEERQLMSNFATSVLPQSFWQKGGRVAASLLP
jgi:hypothetical protein